MSDLVVEEYAHLVRSLEGRSTSQQVGFEEKEDGHTSHESLDGLSTARAGLQKLLIESNSECQSFHTTDRVTFDYPLTSPRHSSMVAVKEATVDLGLTRRHLRSSNALFRCIK